MTRMWIGIHPLYMCNEHIKRELHEINQLVAMVHGEWDIEPITIIKKVAAHAARGQIDTRYIQSRWLLAQGALKYRGETFEYSEVPEWPDHVPHFTSWSPGVIYQNQMDLDRKCSKCVVWNDMKR